MDVAQLSLVKTVIVYKNHQNPQNILSPTPCIPSGYGVFCSSSHNILHKLMCSAQFLFN